MKDKIIETVGVVIESLPGAKFKVKLREKEDVVVSYLSGKMRKNKILIIVGDTVTLEMTPYDLKNARIVRRGERVPIAPKV